MPSFPTSTLLAAALALTCNARANHADPQGQAARGTHGEASAPTLSQSLPAGAQDDTLPGERVTGNQLDRYPVERSPGPDRVTASRRSSIASLLLPGHSVQVVVQYPFAYGYQETGGASGTEPNSCSAFFISVLPASSARLNAPVRIDANPAMRNTNGAYACDYLASGLPFDVPLRVHVAMSDQRAAGSAIWLGGSQPQPAPGQRRTVADGDREITLSVDQPNAVLRFEMTYRGAP